MPTTHAFDFLATQDDELDAPICVLFGDESFLRRHVLSKLRKQVLGDDDDVPYALCDGKQAQWVDVSDELSTVSLFGGGRPRLAVVEDADQFVTSHRSQLEDYAAKKRHTGRLILLVNAWASNTRLFKAVDKVGLQIECRCPEKVVRKRKALDETKMTRWIIDWGKQQHSVVLKQDAASLLLELVGPEFGLLDQDLAKLALYIGENDRVTVDMISEIIGGWKTKTIWELVDAAADGETAEALAQMQRLVQSGESPIGLFAQLSWSLRRLSIATRIFELAEQQGRKIGLQEALIQAGYPAWNKGGLAKAQNHLKKLGRVRAGRLTQWLAETDLQLKSSHSHADRARFALERLLARMSKQIGPRKAVS